MPTAAVSADLPPIKESTQNGDSAMDNLAFSAGFLMTRKSYRTEQIIGVLRQAEVMLSQGKTLDPVT